MKVLLIPVLMLASVFNVFGAETIFDNTDNFQLRVNSTLLESGDQVQFEGDGRVIDYFAFEYFATPSVVTHGATARVRFYLNNGPVGTNNLAEPRTLIYDSGIFLLETNSSTVEISGLQLVVPTDTLTWTVQFEGILTNERAGALFYDPPLVGSSDDFLWQRENGQWRAVKAATNVVNNLSARFQALPVVKIKSLTRLEGGLVLIASASAGKIYSVEMRSTFTEGLWVPVDVPEVRAEGAEIAFQLPFADERFRAFRVVEQDFNP